VRNSGITFQRPHNDFLWILSETGLVGFLLILIVIVYTGVRYHKTQLQNPSPRTMALFSGLVALLVDAFFSLDKERPLLILYAAVLFAALLRQILVPLELQNTRRSMVLVGICILLCFGVLVSAFRISGEYHTQQLLLSKNNNDLTQMSIQGRKALSPFYTCDPTSTPIASYIGYAYERMNRADSMLVHTEQAYQLAPYDYEVLNNYGMMMARAGQLERADTLLREAYRINPYFEVTRLNLAVTAFNRKKFAEAKHWLSTIPNFQMQYPAQTSAIMNAQD
jgi:tetratricopeptide (TPR) repeat protein